MLVSDKGSDMNHRAFRTRLGASICLMLASASFSSAQDWPQWRGPNRDAKMTGFNVPASWPKELTKKWQVAVGDGVATPALVGNRLYVFTRQDDKEILRCLDAATGKEVWQKSYEAKPADRAAGRFPGPRSSPTVADGKVVTFGVRGMLCCFDANSGNELWKKDNFPDSYPQFFTSSSPIVVDGLCITQEGGNRDGGVIAYNLATGDEKWRWMESGPGYGSPVIMEVDGAKFVITPTDDKLVALGVADGKLMWEIPYKQGRYNSATPIVEGTTLVIAGPGTGLTAFKLTKDGDKLVEEKVWSNTDNSVGFNTPVIKNGVMFGLSGASQLFCLDTETNITTWSAPFSKAAAPAQEPPKTGVSQTSGRVPATFVQFVQQDAQEEKGRAEERPRPESDRERGSDRPRGEGRGRGPGGGPGRGFGRGRGGGDRGYGSIVDVGSALLALTPGGELIAYKPASEAFTELARYKVASEGTYAYPIPCAHGIYVKDKEAVTLWTIE
jgi:outer membrane protein assembly factor BamB